MGIGRMRQNYKRLDRLLKSAGGLRSFVERQPGDEERSLTLKQEPYMDLHVQYLHQHALQGRLCYVLSLAHLYEQNGDLIPDPDMTVSVDLTNERVEPLSLQNNLGTFRNVYYTDENGALMWNPRLHNELCGFLAQWLVNLRHQGFYR